MSKKRMLLLALWLPLSAWAGFFVVEEPAAGQEPGHLANKERRHGEKQQLTPASQSSLSSQSRWSARAGSTLHESILAWGQQAGWKIYWRALELDYPILGNLVYEGSFETAISAIFKAHEKAERPLLVDGNSKQKVLVIREKK